MSTPFPPPKSYYGSLHKQNFNVFSMSQNKLEQMFKDGKGDGRGGRKFSDQKARRKKNRRKQNKKYIYAYQSLLVYKAVWRRFSRYLQKNKIHVHSWPEVEAQIDPYLAVLRESGKSAAYIKLNACAINKLFQGRYLSNCEHLGSRSREAIEKSRNHDLEYFQKFADKRPELFRLGLATGLRREKELAAVKGNDLCERSGRYYFHVRGKNGQWRYAPIVADEATLNWIIQICEAAGSAKIFPHIPKYDQHALRAVYACRLYQQTARPIDEIPREERYYCRRDYRGVVLDRRAMRTVSEALGHHRVGVFSQSYAWPMITMAPEIQAFFGLEAFKRVK